MKAGRGFARAIRTAGTITMNSTAWANTSTTLDLTLAASTGDVISAQMNAISGAEAVNACHNFWFVASGVGFSTRNANTDRGLAGLVHIASRNDSLTGGASKTVATADISGGNVITRLKHRTLTAANRTILGTTSQPLLFEARNHGPHVAP